MNATAKISGSDRATASARIDIVRVRSGFRPQFTRHKMPNEIALNSLKTLIRVTRHSTQKSTLSRAAPARPGPQKAAETFTVAQG
jgi:hypothetical protein